MYDINIWKNTLDPIRKGWRWSLPYVKEDQFIGWVAPTYGWSSTKNGAQSDALAALNKQNMFRKYCHEVT